MNTREKRLLILFGVVIFAVLNFYGYSLYSQKMNSLELEIGSEGNEILGKPATGLIGEIALAEQNLAERESKEREMAWLAENEPDPEEGGAVQSRLESFVTNQARAAGLTTDRPKILPNDTEGVYYHKAIFEIKATGMEDGLYRWLIQLHDPSSFRAVTSLRLSPNREDDTQIDAVVRVQQWYVPQVL
jgi:hypothetical protein